MISELLDLLRTLGKLSSYIDLPTRLGWPTSGRNRVCQTALTQLGIPISGLAIHPTTDQPSQLSVGRSQIARRRLPTIPTI
jgi:hypothetical protein